MCSGSFRTTRRGAIDPIRCPVCVHGPSINASESAAAHRRGEDFKRHRPASDVMLFEYGADADEWDRRHAYEEEHLHLERPRRELGRHKFAACEKYGGDEKLLKALGESLPIEDLGEGTPPRAGNFKGGSFLVCIFETKEQRLDFKVKPSHGGDGGRGDLRVIEQFSAAFAKGRAFWAQWAQRLGAPKHELATCEPEKRSGKVLSAGSCVFSR